MPSEKDSRALFREEIQELLSELDEALLDLEKSHGDKNAVDRLFRAIHTIKGACNMFGEDAAAALTHDVETVFDKVRNGLIRVDKPLVDLTFKAKDRICYLLGVGQAAPGASEALDFLKDFESVEAASTEEAVLEAVAAEQAQTSYFHLRFCLGGRSLLNVNPADLIDEITQLGEAEVRMRTGSLPDLAVLNPEACHLCWDIYLRSTVDEDTLRDEFIFFDSSFELEIKRIGCEEYEQLTTPAVFGPEAAPVKPVQAGTSASSAPEPVQAAARPAPAKAAAKPLTAPPASSAQADPGPDKRPAAQPKKEQAQSLRVDAAKLDILVNLVGELVIAQARLSQVASSVHDARLLSVAEEIERLSNELRDNTLGIRMLPIGSTFSKFRRLVRDLSAEMRKEIELVTEGEETELDKTVIEQLGDPLVHLLRNSIDHGIESPETREQAGKPRRGTILLSAEHAGGQVVIRISDDGNGIDASKVRAKAVEKGLISADARLNENETFGLIFAPGFSTAEKITNVSGRGVGMDVVKKSIEALRGKIEITSEFGRGTVITIKLPLTLAIIDGLMIMAGGEYYVIPLTMVEECVEIDQKKREASQKNRTLHLRGEIVPYVRLREVFDIPGELPYVEQVVVTRHENQRTGIAVDEVIGQLQTVIKSLGRIMGQVEGVSGATINGDGSMALILDVPGLVQTVLAAQA